MCHILYLNVVKMHLSIRGPVLWNALPENIKKCETLNCFKKLEGARASTGLCVDVSSGVIL